MESSLVEEKMMIKEKQFSVTATYHAIIDKNVFPRSVFTKSYRVSSILEENENRKNEQNVNRVEKKRLAPLHAKLISSTSSLLMSKTNGCVNKNKIYKVNEMNFLYP